MGMSDPRPGCQPTPVNLRGASSMALPRCVAPQEREEHASKLAQAVDLAFGAEPEPELESPPPAP